MAKTHDPWSSDRPSEVITTSRVLVASYCIPISCQSLKLNGDNYQSSTRWVTSTIVCHKLELEVHVSLGQRKSERRTRNTIEYVKNKIFQERTNRVSREFTGKRDWTHFRLSQALRDAPCPFSLTPVDRPCPCGRQHARFPISLFRWDRMSRIMGHCN